LRRLMGDQALTNRAAREAIVGLHKSHLRTSDSTLLHIASLSTTTGARA
jgi:hypothetical protein